MPAILLAGFGGQGILFAGKQLVTAGMNLNKQVSWLPSYGPEMRGGTCNCSVNIDDEPIGSPLVTNPDVLLAFNKPSYDKFINKVKPGGFVFIDSSLINEKCGRTDITALYIPATEIADKNGFAKLANVVMLGAVIRILNLFTKEQFIDCLVQSTPKSKPELAELNKKAFEIGYNYNI
ncbi:MAG: 2-oxoacid:ferredoxin oxidoreductase subunit gamma [Clostridiales bacterium]|jgi:2-oxoglutarate ferredoxin oxidoreductase subunit gamma|nr:2-oxoacid:ferredoxin oxidoreductase subunit gamma [Clostridiales bacterium]